MGGARDVVQRLAGAHVAHGRQHRGDAHGRSVRHRRHGAQHFRQRFHAAQAAARASGHGAASRFQPLLPRAGV
ncbi:hypothetical protein G6F62_015822 [Rhizopus arrhizus]|nr:hypothetical protein G6F62_015822 [Rhizopus arrhizus]